MQPTVGRIVHFYTADQAKQSNGQGNGPYPAIVTQVFAPGTTGQMCNLKVFPPFKSPYDEGSVHTRQHAEEMNYGVRYWEWPPRDSEAPASADAKAPA